MDFKKIRLAYKGSELVKNAQDAGPAFKRIYQLFGASYPGEYHPPKNNGGSMGSYVLSWAGIAFTFPLQHSAYSPQKDHVSMLGSSAASPATTMALFEGTSWPEVRNELFVRIPSGPRLSAIANKPSLNLPPEIEEADVQREGRIQFLRRAPAPPFSIVLNQTTPQDLITELGPPDATHKRDIDTTAPEPPAVHKRTSSMSNGRPHAGSQPSSYSSTGTDTFDTDFDSGDADEDPADRASRETFWCYFSHGMDILVGPPSEDASSTPSNNITPLSTSTHLVVTKVILHGNVPGSYAFNRHRRLRWNLSFPDTPYITEPLTSETKFEDLKPTLLHVFRGVWPDSQMGRGKVVNRTWGGAGVSESGFFLPDAETELVEGGGSEQWLGNTRMFAFPGLGFEVLENGAVSGLTVC